jgi:hypothetical protein
MPSPRRVHQPSLRSLAAAQDEVVSREQLLALGLSQGQIGAQTEARRWRQLNEAVLVLHNGPMTRRQREWAVVLSAPAPSALCGLTAAARAGLTGFETDDVHVLVERGAKVLPLPGVPVKVHESRRFSADDIYVVNMPCRVSTERALVDAAAWSHAPHQAARIVVAGVQQRLTTAGALVRELDQAGNVRHHRLLRMLLADLEGGAQALSEVAFLRFCRRHSLPRPQLNVRTDVAGRRRYLDAVFRRSDGAAVRVEIDGGVHLNLTRRWLDTKRDNDMVLAGRATLRFPSAAIYANDADAVRQLRQALKTCQTLIDL